jgi:hypothetical protein
MAAHPIDLFSPHGTMLDSCACKSGPTTEAFQSGPLDSSLQGRGLPFAVTNLAAISPFFPPQFASSLAGFLRSHAVSVPFVVKLRIFIESAL